MSHWAEAQLARLPAPLHRLALRSAHGLRKRWWRLRQPEVAGVRILALNDRGHVLLVRHSYGPAAWFPPGGGLEPGEDPLVAAARELAEELGCTLAGPALVAIENEPLHGAINRVHVVVGQCQGTPCPDQREIVEAQFFPRHAPPAQIGMGLDTAIPQWLAAYAPPADPTPSATGLTTGPATAP